MPIAWLVGVRLLWWLFVGVAGLFALALIALNLAAWRGRGPGGEP